MKTVDLTKVDPKFRLLTDLLFFTDRTDIDLSNYNYLLKSNYNIHYKYFIDRFSKSSEIFWNKSFWNNRFSFIVSLHNRKFLSSLEAILEKKFLFLIKTKNKLDINHNVELTQFLEFFKVKKNSCLDVSRLHSIFAEFPFYLSTQRLVSILDIFVPDLYSSFNEYGRLICNSIKFSSRNLHVFLELEKLGKIDNKAPLLEIVNHFISQNNKLAINKHRRIFLQIIEDQFILNQIKSTYDESLKNKIIDAAKVMILEELDEYNFKNIKNIILLDSSLSDQLTEIYLTKLYSRYTTHKMANIDRVCKMIHFIPEVSSKKILSWLSLNNKLEDIKYLMIKYPDCKKFAAFV